MKANITPIDPTLKAFRKGRTAVNTFAGINAYSTTATPSESLIEVWAVEEHEPLDLSKLGGRVLIEGNAPCIQWLTPEQQEKLKKGSEPTAFSIGYDTGAPGGDKSELTYFSGCGELSMKQGDGTFKRIGMATGRFTPDHTFPKAKVMKASAAFSKASQSLRGSLTLSSEASQKLSETLLAELAKKKQECADKEAQRILNGSAKKKPVGLLNTPSPSHKLFSKSKNQSTPYNLPIMPGMCRRVAGHLRELANSHPVFDPLHPIIHKIHMLHVGNVPFVPDHYLHSAAHALKQYFDAGTPGAPNLIGSRGLALPEEAHFTDQIMAGISPECNAARHAVINYESALVRLFKRRSLFGRPDANTVEREQLYLSALNITLNFLSDVLGSCETGRRFAALLAPLTVLFYVDLFREDPVKVAACINHAISKAILADFSAWDFHHPKQPKVWGLPLHPELTDIRVVEYEEGQKVKINNLGYITPPTLSVAPMKDLTFSPLRFRASEIAPNVLVQDW
ncbi:VHS1031 protein [Vibrio phage 1]|nr:VHS1031 protein [Vibrio phage 1]